MKRTLIEQKRKRYANTYKVLYGRGGMFYGGKLIKGIKKSDISSNKEDPIFSMDIDGKNYVLKRVGYYGEDEYDIISRMIIKNLACSQMIPYYACIKSMINSTRYIVMERGDMDLKDYIRKHDLPITKNMIIRILKLAFDIQLWCIHKLKMIYTDFKTRNVLVIAKDKEDPTKGYDLYVTDIGLMEDSRGNYKLDWKMLKNDDIVNFMYPRQRCRQQQCGYFIIAMMALEMLLFHLTTKSVIEIKGSPNAKVSPKKETFSDAEVSTKEEIEKVEETSEKEEISTLEGKIEEESDYDSEYTSDYTDQSTDDTELGFITLLDGRETDDVIYAVLERLPFLLEPENRDLQNFLTKMLKMDYEDVKTAYNDFIDIFYNKNDDK